MLPLLISLFFGLLLRLLASPARRKLSRQRGRPKPNLSAALRRFLQAYASALCLRIGRLQNSTVASAQLFLLQIRQVLATMQFGRGLLHG